jgi:4-hydroxy-3-polyprenylbenzoate decarboxylase
MSALANSYADNLIIRAGDVTLKERKKLVLLIREAPLHIGHIRNMERLCEMGAIIMPPVPAFYHKPKTIQDIIDHTIGKTLDLVGLDCNLFQRWQGIENT